MGSAASMEKDTLKPLLLSIELVDGSALLVSDALLRVSFMNYLKGGAWLDRLSQLVPDSQSGSNGDSRNDADCMLYLREYNVDQDILNSYSGSAKVDRILSISLSGSPLKPQPSAIERYGDLYSGETKSFNHEELLVILLSLLYPIYLLSKEYEHFVKYGSESNKGSQDECSVRSAAFLNPRATHMVQTNHSKRAQELMLSCAARYDETVLLNYLQKPAWLQRVCAIFRDHALALCITDTANAGLPVLFANKAFCTLFGYAETELVGQNFSIFNAPNTEPQQQTLMHNSIRSTETVKFSITLQNKSKKPILDLVAQKAVGCYSISSHVAMAKSAPLDALNMVDDVLILLSYLVKAPALPAPRPSWLPAPIAVLVRGASGAMSQSPSSTRSKDAAAGRGSGNNSRPSSGSVRSVRAGLAQAIGRNNSNGSSNPSFRSFRPGTVRRASNGEPSSGSPTSHRSGSSSSGAGGKSTPKEPTPVSELSAGKHLPADEDAVVEFSVGESTS